MKYHEITLLDTLDCNRYFLWSKLYQQLHLAFAAIENDQKIVQVGVSFPEYTYKDREPDDGKIEIFKGDLQASLNRRIKNDSYLGSKIRIFGETELLKALNLEECLRYIQNYIHISEERSVPSKVKGYAVYHRKKVMHGKERLVRRIIKRKGVSQDEAEERLKNYKAEELDLPFIRLQSLSSKNNFCLFIEKKLVNSDSFKNGFNSYGLSKSLSSVPEF